MEEKKVRWEVFLRGSNLKSCDGDGEGTQGFHLVLLFFPLPFSLLRPRLLSLSEFSDGVSGWTILFVSVFLDPSDSWRSPVAHFSTHSWSRVHDALRKTKRKRKESTLSSRSYLNRLSYPGNESFLLFKHSLDTEQGEVFADRILVIGLVSRLTLLSDFFSDPKSQALFLPPFVDPTSGISGSVFGAESSSWSFELTLGASFAAKLSWSSNFESWFDATGSGFEAKLSWSFNLKSWFDGSGSDFNSGFSWSSNFESWFDASGWNFGAEFSSFWKLTARLSLLGLSSVWIKSSLILRATLMIARKI